MKRIKFNPQTSINYLVSKGSSTSYVSDTVSSLTNSITIADNFVNDNFELVSSSIKHAHYVWHGYNNKVFFYDDMSGKLFMLYNGTVTTVNNNFTSVLDNCKNNISGKFSVSKLKYSGYHDVFYMVCSCDKGNYVNDNSSWVRFIKLSGNNYETTTVSSSYAGTYTSAGSASCYTYEGPYLAFLDLYVNNYNSTTSTYEPLMRIFKTTDGTSWSSTVAAGTNAPDMGSDASLSSYNGTYYLVDPLGYYFNQTVGVIAITTDPTNLSSATTNNVLTETSRYTSATIHAEYNALFFSNNVYRINNTYYRENGTSYIHVMQGPTTSARYFNSFTSNTRTTTTDMLISDTELREWTINGSSVSTYKRYYHPDGGVQFYLRRGDSQITSSIVFVGDYVYQISSAGLVRCHINNLVERPAS